MPEVIHSTCNMGARDSPDMYALGLRAYISGKSLAPMLQLLHKPHHEEDIFVITRGVNNKDILRVQVGFNWLLSQHGFYTTCLQ